MRRTEQPFDTKPVVSSAPVAMIPIFYTQHSECFRLLSAVAAPSCFVRGLCPSLSLSFSRSIFSFPLSLSFSRMHVRPHWQTTSVLVFSCYSYAPAAPHHPPLSSSRNPSAAAAWRLATTDRGGFVSGHTFGPPQEPTAPLITRSRLPPQYTQLSFSL